MVPRDKSIYSIGFAYPTQETLSTMLSEADVQRRSVRKVFLEISQNSQKNTCARISLLIKLRINFEDLIKNTIYFTHHFVGFVGFL